LTGKSNSVLYAGVTRELKKRVYEHRSNVMEGFTKQYNLTKLVYYEVLDDPHAAIAREKQIKAGTSPGKNVLVNAFNPGWTDLCQRI